jgi:hypothetical protein
MEKKNPVGDITTIGFARLSVNSSRRELLWTEASRVSVRRKSASGETQCAVAWRMPDVSWCPSTCCPANLPGSPAFEQIEEELI